MAKVKTVKLPSDLLTQVKDKGGDATIVITYNGTSIVGFVPRNPDANKVRARVNRVTRKLRTHGADASKVRVSVRKAPTTAVNVQGMTATDIAEQVFGLATV